MCVCWEGGVDVGAPASLDDSFKSLPYRTRGSHTPTPAVLMPVIAAPLISTRTSRTNLPSTVCDPTQTLCYSCLLCTAGNSSFVVRFSFFSVKPRDWLGRTCVMQSIVFQVGCKTII